MDLTAALAAAWPPADPAGAAAPDPAGYRRAALHGTRPLAACLLGGAGARHAAALAAAADGGLRTVPLVRDGAGGTWRVARPGDGTARALAALLAGSGAPDGGFALERVTPLALPAGADEAAIGTDQTNETAIVGGAVAVKWILAPDPARERAPLLLRHLSAAGWTGMPAWHGRLLAPLPDGSAVTVAMLDRFLPGATDGWTWCVDALLAHLAEGDGCAPTCPARFAGGLGSLLAGLHAALATPTAVLPAPVGRSPGGSGAHRHAAARATLAAAIAATRADDPAAAAEVADRTDALVARLAPLAALDGARVQPVHGDFHVGQVLRSPAGLAIVDFDGNPVAPADALRAPDVPERDLAGLLCSLDHVGRIAFRRAGAAAAPRVEAWIATAIAEAAGAYAEGCVAAGIPRPDAGRVTALRVEQEMRELLYAAEHLPRWRYAPIGAIRAMVPR